MSLRPGIRLRAGHIVVSCLLCFGFWQMGQGAYIPAKAWVAQELMQRAWRRVQDGPRRRIRASHELLRSL